MDYRSLQIFVDLAHELHFASVAERYNMSPSTLSRTIQRLELELGEPLLARDNRNASLTPTGEAFCAYAQKALDEWSAFTTSLASQQRRLSGTVSLYCSVTASHSLLSGVIARLDEQHSGIELKLHTGDQALSLSRVLEGDEDFAIAAKPEKLDPRLLFKTLSTSRLVLIGPAKPCLLERQLVAMRSGERWDWTSLPWIMPERGLVRKRLDHWLRAHHLRPPVYAEVSGNEAIVSMVGLGLGIGLVPELVIASSPASASIAVIDAPDMHKLTTQAFDVGLCVQKRRLQEPIIDAVWSAAGQTGRS